VRAASASPPSRWTGTTRWRFTMRRPKRSSSAGGA
jgi:hypothetical protein